jgi:host factor-I protein
MTEIAAGEVYMDKQSSQNIQDAFLNSARKDRIVIAVHLIFQNTPIAGRIKSFDKFSILMDVNGAEVLVFKHAIATISLEKAAS